jgi:putative membrane protein insertion efficiency factor
MSALLRALIRMYRYFVAPLLPPACRFHPTCSAYAEEAVRTHGALRGSWLSASRLCRCGPWHAGGVDPVPPAGKLKGSH